MPILVLLDFSAAFPPISHEWLHEVSEGMNFWFGFGRAVKNLDSDNNAYGRSNGVTQYLFDVLSGVLQGCPLSGTLSVLAMELLVFLFSTRLQILFFESVQTMLALHYLE